MTPLIINVVMLETKIIRGVNQFLKKRTTKLPFSDVLSQFELRNVQQPPSWRGARDER